MRTVTEAEGLSVRIERFKQDGYSVFKGFLTPEQVRTFTKLREDQVEEHMFTTGASVRPGVVGNLLEKAPRAILPVVANPELIRFAERVMGPFVQLDAVVINCDSPDPTAPRGKPRSWHRDRFGSVPSEGVYIRPLTMVVLSYLQSMTLDLGPLHVVPGSHMRPMLLTKEETKGDLPGQLALELEPGDAVILHHNLLHSAGHNTSGQDRCFLGFVFNLNGMSAEDNFAGPNCRALVERARKTGDRRLRRLLGDAREFVVARQVRGGFLVPDEEAWLTWIAEDDEAEARDSAEQPG